jgi:TetR/AcrR family transcriptional regulator
MQRTLQRAGRERDADAAREAILNAAQEIFARDGFSGARVDDIARHAGYNKALIFHYFDDKLGLYRALMSRTKERLFARFEAAFDRIFAGDSEHVTAERIRALAAECLGAIFDFYTERPQAGRILAWEAAEGWQTFTSCAPATPNSWSRRVLALLDRAQAAGIVRADLDPRLLFTTVMSMPLIHLISLPRFAAIFPDADFTSPAAIAHARRQIIELVLRGILTPTMGALHPIDPSHITSQGPLAHPAEEA